MIKYYDMSWITKRIKDAARNDIDDIMNKNNYIYDTKDFEDRFKRFTGASYCIGVSSGTAALHLALDAIGIKKGDQVATVSHTFRATVAAIKYVGAEPVYVDIQAHSFCMDPLCLEKTLDNNPNIKAVIAVHLYGNSAEIVKIKDICKSHNVKLIEDCSQAHGTFKGGKHVGTFGDIGTFSFFPGKGVGAFGDAGACVTNDKNYNDYITEARSWKEDEIGYNYRMSTINARFLHQKINDYKKVLLEKREIAKKYDEHFRNTLVGPDVEHSYHIYSILHPHRDKLMEYCKENGVELKCHYPLPVHKLPAYKTDKYLLPVTDVISQQQVSLPIYPGVDWERVVKVIKEYDDVSFAVRAEKRNKYGKVDENL
jgi:dTDP-4-amino-4,6-dideoxygalactose transaminase